MAKQSVTNDLRQAVLCCGKSRYQIAKETGIQQSVLSRFVNQGGGLSMEGIDLVCECIGMRLASDGKPSKPRATKRAAVKLGKKKR
jgi:DNA-binding phage protein